MPRRHIAAQFLVESTAMGALRGIVGASIGVLVVVAISASRTWTPVLDPWIPLAAPLLGAAIGLVSGTYPAVRRGAHGARRRAASRHMTTDPTERAKGRRLMQITHRAWRRGIAIVAILGLALLAGCGGSSDRSTSSTPGASTGGTTRISSGSRAREWPPTRRRSRTRSPPA